jgi:hypothetical protein
MAKSEVDRVTEEKIAKGGILVRMYFDMEEKDKDKLQSIMLDLVNHRLMKEPGVVYCYGAIEEPLERKGVFITSASVTVLFSHFLPLVGIAFKYAPAGVEILKPEREMHFKISDLQNMLMDLSQISVDYSKYILEKVLKPEDMELIKQQIENRVEIGKKIRDSAKPEEKKEKK